MISWLLPTNRQRTTSRLRHVLRTIVLGSSSFTRLERSPFEGIIAILLNFRNLILDRSAYPWGVVCVTSKGDCVTAFCDRCRSKTDAECPD